MIYGLREQMEAALSSERWARRKAEEERDADAAQLAKAAETIAEIERLRGELDDMKGELASCLADDRQEEDRLRSDLTAAQEELAEVRDGLTQVDESKCALVRELTAALAALARCAAGEWHPGSEAPVRNGWYLRDGKDHPWADYWDGRWTGINPSRWTEFRPAPPAPAEQASEPGPDVTWSTLVRRYQRCARELWDLFPTDPLPHDCLAQPWIEQLEELVKRKLLIPILPAVVRPEVILEEEHSDCDADSPEMCDHPGAYPQPAKPPDLAALRVEVGPHSYGDDYNAALSRELTERANAMIYDMHTQALDEAQQYREVLERLAADERGPFDAEPRARQIARDAIALADKKPRIFRDGSTWCAVPAGFVNLQESVAGFGDSPVQARRALVDELARRGT